MKDNSLGRLIAGGFLTFAGLGFVIFHKSIKEWRDNRNSRPWPLGHGESWTGNYTRGGLIFTYGVIILLGLLLLALGIVNLFSA